MSSNNMPVVSSVSFDSASGLIAIVGLLLGAGGLTYIATHPASMAVGILELALVSMPAAAIIYGGYWLAAHHIPSKEKWNIAKLCITGSVLAAVLLLGYIRAEHIGGESVIDPELLLILGGLGGGFLSLYSSISNERQHMDYALDIRDNSPVPSMDAAPFSTDAQTLAELVQDTRSWYVLWILRHAECPLGVESVAARIASIEGVNTRDVQRDLQHVRLPKLAGKGLIQQDTDVDVVQISEKVSTVASASEELSKAGEEIAPIGQS
ncbi:hypothetical protein [Natrinema caseinilyticum]|uniref:hypothetical protein n=1 Tax=Natrinema caseinilyticum TaxID=2961570 RepID=UPI0020C49BD9|nr:hypothetical protein [Natrinema caseinilyticum]